MDCGERVGRGVVSYPCTLPRDHQGPCVAAENTASVQNRRRWEEAGMPADWSNSMRADQAEKEIAANRESREARETLAHFQGEGRSFSHPEVSDVGTSRPHPAIQREVAQMASRATVDAPASGPAVRDLRHRERQPEDAQPVVEQGAHRAAATEGLRQRPGDQQLPEVNQHAFIQDLVIEDIEDRKKLGISRYGTALQPFNGRNAIRDAYEEAMDLTLYLRQVSVERDEALSLLHRMSTLIENLEGPSSQRLELFRLTVAMYRALGADRGA